MTGEWHSYKLIELCEQITDGKHGDCNDEKNSGYYFLSAKDVVDGCLHYSNARQITKEDFLDTHRRTKLEPFDILFTNSGTIGRIAIAADNELTSRTTFQKSVALIKPNKSKVNALFLYYLLKYHNKCLSDFAYGTTQKNLLLKDIRNFHVDVPHIIEQQSIAHILSALDDRIELNHRMNETLESIVEAIFRSWFVDFDPVHAKAEGRDSGLPKEIADLFPDSFANSELGIIPTGWRIAKILELSEINACTLNKNDDLDSIEYIEISEVTHGNIRNIQFFERGKEPSRARRKLRHGDTVLSTVRPDRGSYFLCLNPLKNLIASTGFAVISPTKSPWSFIHAALTQSDVFKYLGHQADGGAYPAVRPEIIGGLEVIWPDQNTIVQIFHKICAPLYERIEQNQCESSTLANIRDTLLPKLISGELRVPDAERFVKEAYP